MSGDKVTIRLTNGDTMEVHPDAYTEPNGNSSLLRRAKSVAATASTASRVYEPMREFWTPYEPWMRDVLADDARVSWGIDGDRESRGPWADVQISSAVEMDPDRYNLRIHPDDVPERDEWKAKHAALRADVERLRLNPRNFTDVLMRVADALDADDLREPQP